MKQKNLLFTVATVLCLGYSATLHAQHNELDANFENSIPHDATWNSTTGGYRLAWENLGKKLALTKRTNTVTLIDDCDFNSYDALTMHVTYELDTELPDGYAIYDTKAELFEPVNGETIVNLRNSRQKNHERVMDLAIDPTIVGGLGNIKKIFLQSSHDSDNGGALYVKDVKFDTPLIVAAETTAQKFSSRKYTGNVYLFQNLPAGTFTNATRITFEISNAFDTHTDIACQVWATLDGGGEANISPTQGTAKHIISNGSQDCYLNNVDKSKITGIYIKPLCNNGFCTFDAVSKVYNGSNIIRESGTKTFNARANQDPVIVNLFTSNQPAGTFLSAKQLRLNFNGYSERNTNGGRYRIRALLNNNTTPEISVPYSSGSDNNGKSKTVSIPESIDRSRIVNFTIEQLLEQGEINFEFTTDIINNDIYEEGDGFGYSGINPNRSPYLTLYKGGVVKSDNDVDLSPENILYKTNNVELGYQEDKTALYWRYFTNNLINLGLPNEPKGEPIDASGYVVAFSTSMTEGLGEFSQATPCQHMRFRLETADGHSDWIRLEEYGTHVIDLDKYFYDDYRHEFRTNLKEVTALTIAGYDYETHSLPNIIGIDGFKVFKDVAVANTYDTRFPLYTPLGYAENVNIEKWENDSILEWNGEYSNQIYLKWNEGTDITDLSQYESITINHGEQITSPYRVFVYYGNSVDQYGNIEGRKIANIPAGTEIATVNLAELFGADANRLKDVRCIAIAGSGASGSVKIIDIHLNRTLKGMGFISDGPINGEDLKDNYQLVTDVTGTENKVTFSPEFLMNDNSVITTSETYTTSDAGTAYFYINDMLNEDQVSEVKNVRLKIVSHEDGNIDYSRIYLTNYITLEWDKYKKSLVDNTKLKFRPTLEYKNSTNWDAYYIPIYPEDLTDLKRVSVEAYGNKDAFFGGIAFYDEAGNEVASDVITDGSSPFNFYDIDATQLSNVTRIKVFFKQDDNVSFENITLYKSLPIYAEQRESFEVTDMDYYRADDGTYYTDTYHKQIADVMIGTSTYVVFGEVGATYVGRDGDVQSYYIMDKDDNFLTADQPNASKVDDLIHIHGSRTYDLEDGSYILETNTRPGGYADLSDYSELRIWKPYCTSASPNNNEAPVRAFFVANPETLTGYLTVDSVGTNFPLVVTEEYCSIDLDEIKKLCNGKAYLISIKGMKSSAAPTVDAVSVYKTKANYVIGGDNLDGINEEGITEALADSKATYIDAFDVATTEDYTLPRKPKNSNCLIYTNNSHLIGQNVICEGKATSNITLNNENDFYAPFDVDMNGYKVSYNAMITDKFSTMVLPFTTTVPDESEMRVYTVIGKLDGNTPYVEARQLEPGTELEANTPVLLRTPVGSTSASHLFEGTSITATPFEIKNEGLVGTYTTQRTPGSGSGYRKYNPYAVKEEPGALNWGEPVIVPNRYVLQKQDGEFAFYSVNREEEGNMYKPIATPFKCWLASTNDLALESDANDVSYAKAAIRFIEFTPTGVNELKSNDNKQQAKKIYNLQGLKLNGLQKGFNIVNGEKIYVK